jgi:cytochrome c biogenesis protein CcmG/thiol:disulfide interchange protein DsbE
MGFRRTTERRQKIIAFWFLVLSLGVLSILVKGLGLNPGNVKSTLVGKQAMDFEVEVLHGAESLPPGITNKIRLTDLRGKKVILNFWASWCTGCRDEARDLEAYWQRHRDQDTIVLGVAIQDSPEAAKQFAEAEGKTYPVALDVNGKLSLNYGVYGVPETFLISAEGLILHREAGPVTLKLLEDLNLKFQANRSDPG